MGDNLFEGLPPPSHQLHKDNHPPPPLAKSNTELVLVPPPPKSALKSALKRSKPVESTQEPEGSGVEKDLAAPEKKKLRFKTTTDASAEQVIEAMQKIASHIKNPTKFSKASKLAIQLIHAGSVTPSTSDQFFAILEVAMSSTMSCTDPSVRADYHALFSAAHDASECLNRKQKHQLETWSIMAVVANDLFTDDSFVFSKTAGQLKETISKLPIVTEDDDAEEAAILLDQIGTATDGNEETRRDTSGAVAVEEAKDNEADPFGLDALIPSTVKKDERAKAKDAKKEEDFELKRHLRSQREAVITCLDIAARRYKTPWCQTVIDILVQHAHDNVQRFTSKQRDAIEKLWASVREQHVRRKQGKSVNGKLDVTAFEWLQEKYSTETISIRRAVGSSGERRAQQWLG
ncbi:unnamed protein product [Linum tenue]|uniref:Uncharacterized protein n=1 Tax=Linum tenue TaxID=586396 RepID=A0AAV0P1A9_9ROSI|nr:unnamed protein product [Linum tenue]